MVLINEELLRDKLAANYSLDIINLETISFTNEIKSILPTSFIIES